MKKTKTVCMIGMAALIIAACGKGSGAGNDLIVVENEEKRVVNLFSPMEKTEADVENVARSATDKTIMMAEESLA